MRRCLTVVFALLFGLLAFWHVRHLVVTAKDPRFVRFQRRYDRRAGTVLPPHGVAVDEAGRLLPPPPPGSIAAAILDERALASGTNAVPLALNADLQRFASSLFSGGASRGVVRTGALVALEPATGRIRALVSAPEGAAFNRALDGGYPPGSTFKLFVAAAALDAGLDPLFPTPPEGWSPGRGTPPIRDAEAAAARRAGRRWRGFGTVGLEDALVHSSNTYFAQLGYRLGTEAFDAAVERARLRDPYPVWRGPTLVREGSGARVPEGLGVAALPPLAIGQGALQLSPLAVAALTAAIANDGALVAPTLDPASRPVLRARVCSYATAQRLKRAMRQVVRTGTGKGCANEPFDVCGKTGTAQVGGGQRDHAWFTCFAPYRHPRLVVTVIVENGGFGAEAALPLARAFLREASRRGLL